MGRSLTHKKALDAILFGDSNGGGTGGGDKVSGTTLTYYALSGSKREATGNHTILAYVTGALE